MGKRRTSGEALPPSDAKDDNLDPHPDKQQQQTAKGKGMLRDEDMVAEDPEEKAASEQVCGICFTEGGEERGQLDCCDHYFCFGCIMEWAKVESRCPMCKQRFVTIVRPPLPGVARSRPRTFRIPLRDQVYEPSEEEMQNFIDPYENTACSECQEAGDEGLLLLCDTCDAAAHTYCVGLGRIVPRGDWFCRACSLMDAHDMGDEVGEEHSPNSQLTMLVTPVRRTQRQARQSHQAHQVLQSHQSHQSHQASLARQARLARRRLNEVVPPSVARQARLARRRLNEVVPSHVRSPVVRTPLHPSSNTRRRVFSSLVDSSAGGARTLSQRRRLRQRIEDMRDNWDHIRRGDVQFATSLIAPAPSTSRAVQSVANLHSVTPSDSAPTRASHGALDTDVAQAWTMLEQARALRDDGGSDVSNRQQDCIVPRNRDNSQGAPVRSSLGSELLFKDARASEGRDSTSRQGNWRDHPTTSAHAGNSSREGPDGRTRDYARNNSQTRGNRMGIRSTPSNPRGIVSTSSMLDEQDSAGFGTDTTAVLKEQETSSLRQMEQQLNEQGLVAHISGGMMLPKSEEHGGSTVGHHEAGAGKESKLQDMKDQVLSLVKMELKPLFRSGHIDKQQHKKIAWSATQTLLAALVPGYQGPDGSVSGSLICSHTLSASSNSLLPGCCSPCLHHHINKVVGSLVKKIVGSRSRPS